MRQIIEALQGIKGKDVNIYTDHILFGKQHIKMEFDPEIEIGVGFRCKGQSIYINKDEIVDYCIEKKKIVIRGAMMHIMIILQFAHVVNKI